MNQFSIIFGQLLICICQLVESVFDLIVDGRWLLEDLLQLRVGICEMFIDSLKLGELFMGML